MITLLLVDVQKDFHPGGSLAIPTASDDAVRIASFITKHAKSIHRIVVTLDTHPKWHIAHPTFWTRTPAAAAATESTDAHGKEEEEDIIGQHPAPFTVISSEDIRLKKWIPTSIPNNNSTTTSTSAAAADCVDKAIFAKGGAIPENLFSSTTSSSSSMDLTTYCAEYAHRLESSSSRKFSLTIWPEHCILGSPGHDIVDDVALAISAWKEEEVGTSRTVEYIQKGMNPYTEMYSAICAEVPVDASTSFNYELVDSLQSNTDMLVICGQALSHCVNYTVRDIVSQWSSTTAEDNNNDNNTISNHRNITILKDCMSSVPGFEEVGMTFLQDMMELGVNVETSDTFVP